MCVVGGGGGGAVGEGVERGISSKAGSREQGRSNKDVDVKDQRCISGHLQSPDLNCNSNSTPKEEEEEDRSEAFLAHTITSSAIRS